MIFSHLSERYLRRLPHPLRYGFTDTIFLISHFNVSLDYITIKRYCIPRVVQKLHILGHEISGCFYFSNNLLYSNQGSTFHINIVPVLR